MILFVPLEFLPGFKRRILLRFLLSSVIEMIQYIGMLGYCQNDDVLNDAVGTVVGYAPWRLVRWLIK